MPWSSLVIPGRLLRHGARFPGLWGQPEGHQRGADQQRLHDHREAEDDGHELNENITKTSRKHMGRLFEIHENAWNIMA